MDIIFSCSSSAGHNLAGIFQKLNISYSLILSLWVSSLRVECSDHNLNISYSLIITWIYLQSKSDLTFLESDQFWEKKRENSSSWWPRRPPTARWPRLTPGSPGQPPPRPPWWHPRSCSWTTFHLESSSNTTAHSVISHGQARPGMVNSKKKKNTGGNPVCQMTIDWYKVWHQCWWYISDKNHSWYG